MAERLTGPAFTHPTKSTTTMQAATTALDAIREALDTTRDIRGKEHRLRVFVNRLSSAVLMTGEREIGNEIGSLLGLRPLSARDLEAIISEPDCGPITSAYGPVEAGDLSDIVGKPPTNLEDGEPSSA